MDNCQVFTPNYIVNSMLNMLGYCDDNIKNKTIFEPSFGDGAFLEVIVQRIISYADEKCLDNEELISILDNVYGIEIDDNCYNTTLNKLNALISYRNLEYKWQNIVCGNTLHYTAPVHFDFIVGNPPYRRVMHLDMSTRAEIEKQYQFGVGNTDLYVVFFEHCLNLMNDSGKLCFITPNSYFKNSSQALFREYLADNYLVDTIVDYGNVCVFENAATYTAIVLLDFSRGNLPSHYTMMKTEFDCEYEMDVDIGAFGSKPWVFTSPSDTQFLKDIASRNTAIKDLCDVQYGLATNADKVYIVDKNDVDHFEQDILRPVIKASTLNIENKIIFPYEWDNKTERYTAIRECDMIKKYPNTYKHLLNSRAVLDNRDMERSDIEWYQYARSQGIQNSHNKKFVLKHILSNDDIVCQISEVDEQTLVYSGIYIVVKNEENYEKIKRILLSEEFHKYLFLVGKNMAGGYRNVNAKAIKEYRFNI